MINATTTLAAVATALAASTPARGVNQWIAPAGGSFSAPWNWSAGVAPGPEDAAVFGLSSAYVVTVDEAAFIRSLNVRAGQVTFMLVGGELVAGEPGQSVFEHAINVGQPDGTAQLRIRSGALRAVSSYVGAGILDGGVVEVDGAGSVWSHSAELHAGFAGSASVHAINGGVISGRSVVIGGSFSGVGSMSISGDASALAVEHRLTVGSAGRGTLEVAGGGVAASAHIDIGALAGGTGLTRVSGPGSVLYAQQRLSVGGSAFTAKGGDGSLLIESGASATATDVLVGEQADSFGVITIRGSGSSFSADRVVVGSPTLPMTSPSGVLRIEAEGTLTSPQILITPHGRIEGRGQILGSLASYGLVAPGDDTPGVLLIRGPYLQHAHPNYSLATSVLHVRIGGPPGSPEAGRLEVDGPASLGGRLRIAFEPPFEPTVGQRYEVLAAQSVSGAFQVVQLPERIGVWRCRYVPHAAGAAIEILPGGLPGDTNGDCVVNFADLNNVLSTYGQTGLGLIGDVNGDGVVNFQDLNIVLSYFGVSC